MMMTSRTTHANIGLKLKTRTFTPYVEFTLHLEDREHLKILYKDLLQGILKCLKVKCVHLSFLRIGIWTYKRFRIWKS